MVHIAQYSSQSETIILLYIRTTSIFIAAIIRDHRRQLVANEYGWCLAIDGYHFMVAFEGDVAIAEDGIFFAYSWPGLILFKLSFFRKNDENLDIIKDPINYIMRSYWAGCSDSGKKYVGLLIYSKHRIL